MATMRALCDAFAVRLSKTPARAVLKYLRRAVGADQLVHGRQIQGWAGSLGIVVCNLPELVEQVGTGRGCASDDAGWHCDPRLQCERLRRGQQEANECGRKHRTSARVMRYTVSADTVSQLSGHRQMNFIRTDPLYNVSYAVIYLCIYPRRPYK